MGANPFVNYATGDTPAEAFQTATHDMRHEHGHGGYTGTLAEKHSFTMLDPQAEGVTTDDWSQNDYEKWAWSITERDDPRIEDKWGPAGCVEIGQGEYLFFGWAST